MVRKLASFAVLAWFAGLVAIAPASADNAYLFAYMNGAAERPGPGDPDGVGRAVITIDDASDKVCLSLQFTNVTLPTTGLHIHFAPPTSAGPVVVPFAAPTTNSSYQCVTVEDEAVLDNIAANPGDYYVNLHTQPGFGPGAIRGQLKKA